MPENTPGFAQEKIQDIGKVCWEALEESGRTNNVKKALAERKQVSQEDLTLSGGSALYTTAVASFVEKRLRPKLIAAGVVRKIGDFRMKGFNSIKVPIRDALITASDLPDSGSLSNDSGSYGSQSITLGWKYASNKIGHTLIQHSAVDLISEELGEIGDALARKQDSDIITAIDNACTSGNGNEVSITGATITFEKFLEALQTAGGNYAEPDKVLMNWETFADFAQLTEVKNSMYNQPASDPSELFAPIKGFMGMQVLVTPQVGDDNIYLIDSDRLGYLVEGSPVQTFDGRVSGELNFEVIGAQAYGVAIVQPKAATAIRENAV